MYKKILLMNLIGTLSKIIPNKDLSARFRKHLLPSKNVSHKKALWKNEMPVIKKNIKLIKNKYKGNRCFIVGGAPSLSNLDLSLLNNEYTFVVNKGYLLKNHGLKRATCYGLTDLGGYNEYHNDIDLNFAEYYVIASCVPWNKQVANQIVVDLDWEKSIADGYFQLNILKPLPIVSTVVSVMLQVAVYMGFDKIYFIGVDLDASQAEAHFYKSSKGEIERIKNLISKRNTILSAFKFAEKFLRDRGVRLYNAGTGGKLDVIPRIKYETLFKV